MKLRFLSVGILGLLVIFMIIIGCSGKGGIPIPASFIVSHDASGDWRVVEIRDDLINDKDGTWKVLVDTVSSKYDLETLDKDSGYLRSAWKHTYVYRSQICSKYRSRIVLKTIDNNSKLKVKIESNWLSNRGWLQGYDNILLKDIYSDLQGKIGRVITQ